MGWIIIQIKRNQRHTIVNKKILDLNEARAYLKKINKLHPKNKYAILETGGFLL